MMIVLRVDTSLSLPSPYQHEKPLKLTPFRLLSPVDRYWGGARVRNCRRKGLHWVHFRNAYWKRYSETQNLLLKLVTHPGISDRKQLFYSPAQQNIHPGLPEIKAYPKLIHL